MILKHIMTFSKREICLFTVFWFFLLFLQIVSPCLSTACSGVECLPDTIDRITPSVVGVGTVLKTRRPPVSLRGTGFVVADGLHVITNAHVIPEKLDKKHNEIIAVFTGRDKKVSVRKAVVVLVDKVHDIGLLKISGKPMKSVIFGDDKKARPGQVYAISGYPLGGALGLHLATHRCMIAAITPIILPVRRGGRLNTSRVNHLEDPFPVFQLDGTAYPGNSGSPLFHMETGKVMGIINMVMVKGAKENAITKPSGISYAIPVTHIKTLLKKAGLK